MVSVLGIDTDTSFPIVPISSPIDTTTRLLDAEERSSLLQMLGCIGWVSMTYLLDLRYTH